LGEQEYKKETKTQIDTNLNFITFQNLGAKVSAVYQTSEKQKTRSARVYKDKQ
jgi:hypothetical protein